MYRTVKGMLWIFGGAATATITFGLVLYSQRMLLVQPFWWQRPLVPPTSEDYAAYSAFVNDFFSSKQPFRADQSIGPNNIVLLVSETLTIKNPSDPILPLGVVALGPEDMGVDFFRQNAKSWQLEARFLTHLKCIVVDKHMLYRAANAGSEELGDLTKKGDEGKWLPHASPTGPFSENPQVSGVLQFSRLGFDHSRNRCLVYYYYRCGVLCGQSGWAALCRIRGEWKLDEMGGGAVY